jgi:TATA-binding protein-associated factor Taf7
MWALRAYVEARKFRRGVMMTEITAIYAISDDLLKALGHTEDCRTQMSDAAYFSRDLGSRVKFENQSKKEKSRYTNKNLLV